VEKNQKSHFGADQSTVSCWILSKLPYIVLIAVFLLLHYNVLFNGYYRPHHDHTILHFSTLYFLDGIFLDGEFPLWQPYRHFGTMNMNALISLDPLLIILSQLFLWAGEITGMNSFSVYKVTLLSYITGYILTFVFPCGLLAREVIKNVSVRWIVVGAALFGSHIFLMVSVAPPILFYFPFTILFWIRIMRDADDGNIIANLSGLILSLSLTLNNLILTVYIAMGISALLTSQLPWAGIPHLFVRLKSALKTCSKRTTALLVTSFAAALGLGAMKLAIICRIGEFETKNRAILTKSSYLKALSDNFTYSNHIFQIIDNFLNIFSFNSDLLIKSGLDAPLLYFGIIAIFIFILMFREIEERKLFFFFLTSAVFILICSTNPKDGYNFILPFAYLLNPVFSMGTRHNNLIILYAAPFIIMALCMALDRFVSKYNYITYPHHSKLFSFLIISSLGAFAVYSNSIGYYRKSYIYWYVGLISVIVSMLLYFPRKRLFRPDVTIPLVVAVLVVVEMMFPLRGYIKSFYSPFPKDGGGYFGNELSLTDPIRGWPVPMRHTFSSQFNVADLNTTNPDSKTMNKDVLSRLNNTYFKFSSVEGYDDTTFIEKGVNIENMPWLKKFTDRIIFISSLIPAKEHDEALLLTRIICENGKNFQYAVVEGFPASFFSKDISLVSSKEMDHISQMEDVAQPPSPILKTYTLLKKDFRNIGTDYDNSQSLLYSAKLPDDFPKYLTTNYLNEDYKDITVVDKNGKSYKPTYFDLFKKPLRFQASFRDYRQIVISTDGDAPQKVIINWRDRFREKGIEIVKFSYNTLALKTNTERDSFMVYMDRNAARWKFYLDGIQKDIFTTNGIFKGVFVPRGTHELVFKYSDPLLTTSFAVYILSLFIAWGLLVVLYRSGRSMSTKYGMAGITYPRNAESTIQQNDSCDKKNN
jgi:hypothetical protein